MRLIPFLMLISILGGSSGCVTSTPKEDNPNTPIIDESKIDIVRLTSKILQYLKDNPKLEDTTKEDYYRKLAEEVLLDELVAVTEDRYQELVKLIIDFSLELANRGENQE